MPIVLEPTLVATGQTANSGSFNGLTWGPGTPYHLFEHEGIEDMPSINSTDMLRSQDHGSYAGLDLMPDRDVTLTFNVYAADRASFDALMVPFNAAFQPSLAGVEKPMIFSGLQGQPQQIMCRCRKRAAPRQTSDVGVYRQIPVQLTAMDPRIYDATQQVLGTGLPGPGSGIVWPTTWPVSWGAAQEGGEVIATNAGSFSTPFVATITGPCTNPRIINGTTGQFIGFSIVLATSDVLTVDFGARTVVINGLGNRRGSMTPGSSWWSLPPGETQMYFYAAVSTAAQLTCTFRAAWI